MKTTQLFITCLISTTICALPNNPLGFFANIAGTYFPFSETYDENVDRGIKVLNYQPRSRYAVEFVLENNQAITYTTNIPEYLGLSDGKVSFGHKVRPLTLEFDDDMSVKNMTFQVCWYAPTNYHVYYKEIPRHQGNCEESKVYMLPFNRCTGYVVKNLPSNTSTESVETDIPINTSTENSVENLPSHRSTESVVKHLPSDEDIYIELYNSNT